MKSEWIITAGWVALCGMAQAAYVTIGGAGNAPDGSGYGAVAYEYNISDSEVSGADFAASGAGDGDETTGTTPVVNVSLYEAMKYCNWLTSGNVNNGAYQFNGGGGAYSGTDRASAITTYGTIYAVPTEDEWYKAAYYTGNASDYWSLYAHGTDITPAEALDNTGWNYNNLGGRRAVGGSAEEQNGTYDMMGNVHEWMEDIAGVFRSGAYDSQASILSSAYRGAIAPSFEGPNLGFRPVEVVPEPATALLFGVGGMGAWMLRRHKRKANKESEG